MDLTTSPIGLVSTPTTQPAQPPQPPTRWSRWWTSPIAHFDYGTTSRIPLWAEATIPAERSITGALRPSVVYAGASRDAALAAAHALAAQPVEVSFSYRNGRVGHTSVNPAVAVLRDARAGAYWIAPLATTVRRGSEWIDAPHTIDGPAFAGTTPLLARPVVLSASRDLVAVVGADTVIRPGRWTDAPDNSGIDD